MSFRKLAEQAMRLVAGGDIPRDFPYHIDEFILAIGQERDRLLKDSEYVMRKLGGETGVLPELLSRFVYESQKDSVTGEYYVEIEAPYITLKRDMGVYHVSYPQDRESWKRIPTGGHGIYDTLLGEDHMCNNTWRPEGDRVYLPDVNKEEGILVKVISTSDTVDPRGPSKMPSAMESDVMRNVANMFIQREQAGRDRANDGAYKQQ